MNRFRIDATSEILRHMDILTGRIDGTEPHGVRLSGMRGYFVDKTAFERMLLDGDPTIYTVCAVEEATGEGNLHYGLGRILPGQVGAEYFMTKGHYHSLRQAAEVYIGLEGEGRILLEDEHTGEGQLVRLEPHDIVYVRGCTAHRTINVGATPLTYLGVYPANAGHDYGPIARHNFQHVLLNVRGIPALMRRADVASSETK